MTSKVTICNMALVKLGANRVTDIDNPSTNEEKICNIIFDTIVEEVMASGSWTSIMRRASLVQTINTPEFGFLHEYQLPVDPKCLHVVNINECRAGDFKYVIEGDKLLCDLSTVDISYRALITSPGSWSSRLVSVIIARLTAELCLLLSGKDNAADAWFQKYKEIHRDKLAEDNQQGSHQYSVNNDLLDVR